MIIRWMGALFAPKYPRGYKGRHRGLPRATGITSAPPAPQKD
jgi:hypothetical protein